MVLITANGFGADGKIPDALRNCELALGVDPLNLELQPFLIPRPPRSW